MKNNLLMPPMDFAIVGDVYAYLDKEEPRRERVRQLAITAWYDAYDAKRAMEKLSDMLKVFLDEQYLAQATGPSWDMVKLMHDAVLNQRVLDCLAHRALNEHVEAYRKDGPDTDTVAPWEETRHFVHELQRKVAELELFVRAQDEVFGPFRRAVLFLRQLGALDFEYRFRMVASKRSTPDGKALPDTDLSGDAVHEFEFQDLVALADYSRDQVTSDLDSLLEGYCLIVSEATDGTLSKATYDPRSVIALMGDKRQEAIDEQTEPMKGEVHCAMQDLDEAAQAIKDSIAAFEGKLHEADIREDLGTASVHADNAIAHLEVAVEAGNRPHPRSAAAARERLEIFRRWIDRVEGAHGPAFREFLGTMTTVAIDAIDHIDDMGAAALKLNMTSDPAGIPVMDAPSLEMSGFRTSFEQVKQNIEEGAGVPTEALWPTEEVSEIGDAGPAPATVTEDDYAKAPPEEERDAVIQEQLDYAETVFDRDPRPLIGDGPAKTYCGTYRDGEAVVVVRREGHEQCPLEQHRDEWMSGIGWNERAQRSLNLARDILWDLLGEEPHPVICQDYRRDVIGAIDHDEKDFSLPELSVRDWYEQWRKEHAGWLEDQAADKARSAPDTEAPPPPADDGDELPAF